MDTKKIELIGDNHELFSLETPLRDDAFVKSNDEKINILKKYVLNSNNGPLLLNYFENYSKTLKKNTLNSYIKSVSNR